MSFKEEKPFKNVSIKICGMLDNNLAVINIASGEWCPPRKVRFQLTSVNNLSM